MHRGAEKALGETTRHPCGRLERCARARSTSCWNEQCLLSDEFTVCAHLKYQVLFRGGLHTSTLRQCNALPFQGPFALYPACLVGGKNGSNERSEARFTSGTFAPRSVDEQTTTTMVPTGRRITPCSHLARGRARDGRDCGRPAAGAAGTCRCCSTRAVGRTERIRLCVSPLSWATTTIIHPRLVRSIVR